MPKNMLHIAQCVTACNLFKRIEKHELAALIRTAKKCAYEKGMVMSPASGAGKGIYILCSGIARVELSDPEKNKKAISYLMAPEHFGEVSMFAKRVDTDVVAHTDLVAIFIPVKSIWDLISSSSAYTEALLINMAHRVNHIRRDLQDSLFKNLEGRVAVQLLKLAYKFGEDVPAGRRITLKLTHEELADLVGTHRETVTKILGIFRKDDAISILKHYIIITHKSRLETWITNPNERHAAMKQAG